MTAADSLSALTNLNFVANSIRADTTKADKLLSELPPEIKMVNVQGFVIVRCVGHNPLGFGDKEDAGDFLGLYDKSN